MDFSIITQGILCGLTLSLVLGPAFFSLIQTSITQGFRSGAHLAMGISLSDISMVFIAWFGVSSLFETDKAQKIIGIVGGIVIIGFGIYTATRRQIKQPKRNIEQVSKFQFKYLLKGFVFNIANPGVWIFWLVPVNVAMTYNTRGEQITFLACMLLTVLCCDLVRCAIAHELKRFLTDRVITIMNRVIGGILIVFGLYLLVSCFTTLHIPSIETI